jgi:uncharacterized protein
MGANVDIAQDDENLEWHMKDGTIGELAPTADGSSILGWTERPEGKRVSFGDCTADKIYFDGVEGHRILFDVVETRFQGAGPSGHAQRHRPRAHRCYGARSGCWFGARGSGVFSLQRLFPSAGIGVFVYGKRGTGASGGKFTADYLLLADDAIAAMREARRLAGARLWEDFKRNQAAPVRGVAVVNDLRSSQFPMTTKGIL